MLGQLLVDALDDAGEDVVDHAMTGSSLRAPGF